jgi:hypothetical protein
MTCSLLSSRANEASSDLAIVQGYFALPDEQADLSGARVLHVRDETFVRRELLVWRERWFMIARAERARSRSREAEWGRCGARNDCDGRGGAGVLEKLPSTNRFHTSSKIGFRICSEPFAFWMRVFSFFGRSRVRRGRFNY